MNINVNGLIDSLPLMAKGMLGIFIVTILIIAVVVILNLITSSKK